MLPIKIRVKSNTVMVTVANQVLAFNAVTRIRGVNPFILVSASRAGCIQPGWRKPTDSWLGLGRTGRKT
jgi:hypothetical protein